MRESSNLDLLRAVAVLCVFFAHLHDVCSGDHSEISWHFGQMGVLIFFVHTSLVLMRSIQRMRLGGTSLFVSFYVRRWFRIYPLSVCCVLWAYASGITPEHVARHWNIRELLTNLSLTQNLFYTDSMVGGLWTLPLEVQMYLVLPILFVLFRSRSLQWLFVLLILTIPVAMAQPAITGRLNVLGYVPCFLGGVLAWRIADLYGPVLSGGYWPAALIAVTPVWLLATRAQDMLYRWGFCLALGLVIPWFRDISWRCLTYPAKVVAKYSYGIYLSHIAVMMFAFRDLRSHSSVVQWSVFVVLAVTVPLIAYHVVENPLILAGRNIVRRFEGGRLLERVEVPGVPVSAALGEYQQGVLEVSLAIEAARS